MNRVTRREGGSALIAVLWLAAALAAITFALATNVRSESERASTSSEGVRAYYLAAGSIDRAMLWIHWGPRYRGPDGRPLFFDFPTARLFYRYATGSAVVEVIPESSKYNINTIPADRLFRLLLILGVAEPQARELTAAIIDWRSASPQGQSPFDSFYAQQPSAFLAPHASIQELEELLLIKGMTPDLFYGHFTRDAEGAPVWHTALRDCLTTRSGAYGFDVNTVEPAVLASLDAPPAAIAQIVARRNAGPIRTMDEIKAILPPDIALKLRIGGGSIVTLRATAWLNLDGGRPSETRKTVAALVKLEGPGQPRLFTVLRWYDNVQSDLLPRNYTAPPVVAGGNGS